MSELTGRVLTVDTRNLTESTVSDAEVGATLLYLTDAAPFVDTSGVCIVEGAAYQFADVDIDADALILTTPLTAVVPEDSAVEVFPPAPEKYATVAFGDVVGDATPVLVPHFLVELLPDGIRDELDQEIVTVETGGAEPTMTNIVGKPLAQGVVAVERLTPELLALIRMRFTDAAQRDALIPTPSDGMSAYLASDGLDYRYSGGVWVPQLVYVKKPSNTTVTSSTTLINDPHLLVDLVPGTYRVELIVHGTASTSGDIKVAWSYSGTVVSGNRAALGMTVDGTSGVQTTVRTTGHFLTTEVPYGLEADDTDVLREDVLLKVSTSGRLNLRWAQRASSSTATTVSAASRMYITRLADRT